MLDQAASFRTCRPATLDIEVVRGDHFELPVVVKVGYAAYPLTGYSGVVTIRRSIDDSHTWELDVDVSQAVAGASTCGQITITGAPEVTTLLPQVGVWDLQVTNGTITKTLLRGAMRLIQETTR